jgi:hypothetical protein
MLRFKANARHTQASLCALVNKREAMSGEAFLRELITAGQQWEEAEDDGEGADEKGEEGAGGEHLCTQAHWFATEVVPALQKAGADPAKAHDILEASEANPPPHNKHHEQAAIQVIINNIPGVFVEYSWVIPGIRIPKVTSSQAFLLNRFRYARHIPQRCAWDINWNISGIFFGI